MSFDFCRGLRKDWQPVSRIELIGWVIFYEIFLLEASTPRGGFLLIDHVNFLIHEAGHILFRWCGRFLGILGGTLLELLVPFLLAVWFVCRRQLAGAAFAMFLFFENFLYISTYMADARRRKQ